MAADILCLQEVDHYHDWWSPLLTSLGYDHVYARRGHAHIHGHGNGDGAHGKADGCVIAWRRSMFTAIYGSHRIVDYNMLCHLCAGHTTYDAHAHDTTQIAASTSSTSTPAPAHHGHGHHHNHARLRHTTHIKNAASIKGNSSSSSSSNTSVVSTIYSRALRNRFMRHNIGHYILLSGTIHYHIRGHQSGWLPCACAYASECMCLV